MKRKLKLLVALVMAMVMAVGCGSNTTPSNTSESQKETPVEQESKVEESKVEESKYPDYLNLESQRPIVKEGEEVTITMAIKRSGMAKTPIDEAWFVQFIENELNINLEIEDIKSDALAERRSLMLSANDMPDMMLALGITTQDIEKYGVENGQFLAMSDYASEELTPNLLALWEKYEDYMPNYTASDGKIYGLPRIGVSGVIGEGDTLPVWRGVIDAKYLDAVGLKEVPTTLDGFMDMLRAFKALDPKEMGVDEIWPMLSNLSYDKFYMGAALGWILQTPDDLTGPAWDAATGKTIIPCMDKEKFTEYVTLYNTMYNERLIHPDYFTLDQTTVRALLATGSAGVMWDSSILNYREGVDNWQEDIKSPLPLTSKWSKTAVTPMASIVNESQVFISADTKYPEVCMRLIDYLCTPEGYVYATNGCPAGKEEAFDTPNFTGYILKDDGSGFTYQEVKDGIYASDFEYYVNAVQIVMGSQLCTINDKRDQWDIAGVEYKEPVVDYTTPGDKTGYLMCEAVEGTLVQGLPFLRLSSDVYTEYSDLKTVLQTYVNAETTKFIVGQRPLSELPKFFEEIKQMGGDRYEEILLDAYKNYTGTN